MKSNPAPMTLGNAAAARVRLILACVAATYLIEEDLFRQG